MNSTTSTKPLLTSSPSNIFTHPKTPAPLYVYIYSTLPVDDYFKLNLNGANIIFYFSDHFIKYTLDLEYKQELDAILSNKIGSYQRYIDPSFSKMSKLWSNIKILLSIIIIFCP